MFAMNFSISEDKQAKRGAAELLTTSKENVDDGSSSVRTNSKVNNSNSAKLSRGSTNIRKVKARKLPV